MKVSIICTNYNKGAWIGEAIDSFLKQKTTFPFEIIVVDDASQDQSPEIIREYAKRHPNLIRPFFNEKNKGITQTWIDICKEARGEYIARCDGDDYWTVEDKLQCQVDLLEGNPESKWSNTDFDMVNSQGEILQRDVLHHGIIPFMDSYEKMLALKGMTMASTWLVDRQLMLEVNDNISKDAVDDTFNIQLELFRRTKLSFLDKSTTVYRMGDESDSRTKDKEKIAQRFKRLLETQLEYVNKYPDSDYKTILELVLKQQNDFEIALSNSGGNFYEGESVKVYLSDGVTDFSEDRVLCFPLQMSGEELLELPDDVRKIRIDLSELSSFYSRVTLVEQKYKTEILPVYTNARRFRNLFIFDNEDPQIIYDLFHQTGCLFLLSYQMFNVENIDKSDYIAKELTTELLAMQQTVDDLRPYKINHSLILSERDAYKRQFEEMTVRYNSVVTSRRWTIPTKIINFFRRNK